MNVKRNTVQRQIIINTLKEFKSHPSVDVLYAEIYKTHPTISKATVYRNLRMLSEEGLIKQIAVSDDVARYDGCVKVHYHFSCKLCNKIFDLEMDMLEGIDNNVQDSYGVKVDGHEILFSGTCAECMT